MRLESPQPGPVKASISYLSSNRRKMLAPYAAIFNLCFQMAGMSWPDLASLGVVIFLGFGLGTFHPGCVYVPAGFPTF